LETQSFNSVPNCLSSSNYDYLVNSDVVV